eukprot:13610325-Alexandrium_andersonii.AAC.1
MPVSASMRGLNAFPSVVKRCLLAASLFLATRRTSQDQARRANEHTRDGVCLLYTSDAADDM